MPAAPLPAPLLLPGTLCDAALWERAALPSRTRVQGVIRGRSLAEAAHKVLEGAPAQLHLVGFSLGAIVAFEVLRQAPERVARLTLLSANPHAPSAAQLKTWEAQEQRVQEGEFDRLADSLSNGPHRRTLLEMARQVGPEVFLEQLHLLRTRPDSRATLARWTGPLTLLFGQEDTVTPPHLAVEMKAIASQAEVRVIPGAGHYLPLDAPRALSDVLREVAYA